MCTDSLPRTGLELSDVIDCVALAQLEQFVCSSPIRLDHVTDFTSTVQLYLQQELQAAIGGELLMWNKLDIC